MMPFLSRRSRQATVTLAAWVFACLVLYRLFLSDSGMGTTLMAGLRKGRHGEKYAPLYVDKLPQGPPKSLPQLQASFPAPTPAQREERDRRAQAIKERFAQTWSSYRELAWGADELAPISGKPIQAFGGWGATLVDSLDSLWIFGMKAEFEAAVGRVAAINFNRTEVAEINVFETTIRYLGGLLGAYDISGARYPVLLEKAVEIGNLLYNAFDTPNRMPITRMKNGIPDQEASAWALIAEIGSFTLEFTRLSQITGDGKYYDAVYRVAKAMEQSQQKTKLPGLWPIIVNANELKWNFNIFSLGGMADSAYEYLPKMSALIGGNEKIYQKMYERAIKTSIEYLFFRPMLPDNADILFSGGAQESSGRILMDPQGQHLTCFVGGMVLLGAKLYERPREIDVGKKLTDGCVWAYDSMPTGIMPEVFHLRPCKDSLNCKWDEQAWAHDVLQIHEQTGETATMSNDERLRYILMTEKLLQGYTAYDDKRYILRPEAIESVFYSYRMTGDTKYVDAAWRMFLSIDKHTQTELAHSGIDDVTTDHPRKDNKMESFWLAETLKYFYLMFKDPDFVSLDRYVLNTEAHTFLRPGVDWKEGL